MSVDSIDSIDPAAKFYGGMGAVCAIALTAAGAAYGTAKSGCGIVAMGIMKPELIMKNTIPVIMAGILAIYGLVVAVLIADGVKNLEYPRHKGITDLCAGLVVGLSGLAAGWAIGIVGNAGVRGVVSQPRLYVGMILILIFSEVLGLYGLIISIFLMTSESKPSP